MNGAAHRVPDHRERLLTGFGVVVQGPVGEPEAVILIDHRGGNQVILVKGIGDLFFVLIHTECAERRLHQFGHMDGARRAQQAA